LLGAEFVSLRALHDNLLVQLISQNTHKVTCMHTYQIKLPKVEDILSYVGLRQIKAQYTV